MARINKDKLKKDQLDKLFNQLNNTLGKLSTRDTNLFLSDLLGEEEKIMIAKRLGVIVLLLEGYSLNKISKILRVSTSTADRLKRDLENRKVDNLIRIIGKNKKDYFLILNTLDSILHLGGILPHYSGTDRYKNLPRPFDRSKGLD